LQRKLELADPVTIEKNESLVIFQFLETLPNLQVLVVLDFPPAYLSQFISSIRHTFLLKLVLHTLWGPTEGPSTAGLAGLERLSINWDVYDNPNEPGSSLAHLYELIRPTLTTLVKLRINNSYNNDFDLQLLKPAADTLRTFKYILQGVDESILDTIPTILPHLTKLTIKWEKSSMENPSMEHSILWKACTILSTSHPMILMSFAGRARPSSLKKCLPYSPRTVLGFRNERTGYYGSWQW
jgi:hypothetical protein